MPWVEIDGVQIHINIAGGDEAWERMSEAERTEIIEEVRQARRRIAERRRRDRDEE